MLSSSNVKVHCVCNCLEVTLRFVKSTSDWMNVENNLLPVLYTFWLCEARPEWTDTCRLFLLEGQRKSFEYIKNSRDKGAYECMQRFTSYIMISYI